MVDLADDEAALEETLEACEEAEREVERLRAEVADLRATLQAGTEAAAAEAKEAARLLDLLGRLEWVETAFPRNTRACPACDNEPREGHDPGCWLAAVLHPRTTNEPPTP